MSRFSAGSVLDWVIERKSWMEKRASILGSILRLSQIDEEANFKIPENPFLRMCHLMDPVETHGIMTSELMPL